MPSANDRQRGFTLIELLVAMTILGVITAALGAGMLVGLRTIGLADTKLTESRSSLFASSYFESDVQSADTVVRSPASLQCGSATTNLITFLWADDVSSQQAAEYVITLDGSTRQLVRVRCQGTNVTGQVVVAPVLTATTALPTCVPNADCSAVRSVTWHIAQPSGFTFDLNATRRDT